MKFPRPLKKGDTIGIVSPASAGSPEALDKGRGVLQRLGYHVVIHPQCYRRAGQLAGSDTDRAQALMDMFANPSIDAIVCGRGGNGSIRILDKLNYNIIKRNPKVFTGFSDITVLLQAISKKCGFVTYHGPTLATYARSGNRHMTHDFSTVVENTGKLKMSYPDVDVVHAGRAEGTLVGGNLTVLQSVIGTSYDLPNTDIVLFIEDVDEVLYRIDRVLNHFRLAGKLKHVKAVICGEMINVPDGETSFMRKGERPYGRDLKQILMDNFPPDIPICMNFPCGHGKYLTTFPVGAKVKLSLGKKGAELSFTR
jgi:muramoyltetrapeptide carboxypeptidase